MVEKAGGYHAPPLQDVPRSDIGQTPLIHNFQRHHGRHHAPLVDGGSRVGGRPRGNQAFNTAPGGLFLRRLWRYCVDAGGPVTTDILDCVSISTNL